MVQQYVCVQCILLLQIPFDALQIINKFQLSWKIYLIQSLDNQLRTQRCYWAVTLIGIFSAAVVLTSFLYNRFLEMPTRITIENQYESVHNIPYPSIAVCSPNQITINALKHFNRTLVDGNRTIDFKKTPPLFLGFYHILGDLDPSIIFHVEALIEANRYHAIDLMAMAAQSCEEFLKLCLFEGKAYPHCETLFYPVLTKIGLCCVFNNIYQFKIKNKRNEKIKNFKVRRINEKYTGLDTALRVVVDYNPENAVDHTVVDAGATRVMIMGATEFPAVYESNLARPHTESFHILHPTYTYCSEEVESLPSNSRKCLFAHEMRVPHFGEYDSSNCNLMCHVDLIERHCHCLMHYVPYVRYDRACNITSIPCIINVKVQMSNWHGENECDCVRDCESYDYRSEMIVGNLNTLEHLVNNPYEGVVFNNSTSILYFFVPSTYHVKKKQETVMSLVIFFSNLGGVYGLFLGCSLISAFELIFFIYLAIKNKFKNRVKVRPLNYIN